MNTAGKAWIVTRQYYQRGERFLDEQDAKTYAKILAQKIAPERVEVFECTENVFVNMPVTTETKGEEE